MFTTTSHTLRSSSRYALPFFLRPLSSTSTPPSSPPSSPSSSANAPKFKLELGLAFAGKPRRRGEQVPRGLIGRGDGRLAWRDSMVHWKQDSSSPTPSAPPSDKGRGAQKDAGEDFFFVREEQEGGDGMTTLAVADGVGGWAESGVDPSIFSQALMWHGWRAAGPEKEQREGRRLRPEEVLQRAYIGVLGDEEVKAGSATACIIQIDSRTGLLTSANLGDSGYAVIRDDSTFIDVPGSQQHYFNCPRQLAKVPHRRGYESNITDLPKDADLFSVQLQEGDVVVLFTDGLGDNIHPSEKLLLLAQARRQYDSLLTFPTPPLTPPASPTSSTASLFSSATSAVSSIFPSSSSSSPSTPPPSTPTHSAAEGKSSPPLPNLSQLYASALLRYGQVCMNAHDKVSPFTLAAAKEGLEYMGGKVDDFTVITAIVKRV